MSHSSVLCTRVLAIDFIYVENSHQAYILAASKSDGQLSHRIFSVITLKISIHNRTMSWNNVIYLKSSKNAISLSKHRIGQSHFMGESLFWRISSKRRWMRVFVSTMNSVNDCYFCRREGNGTSVWGKWSGYFT